MVRDLDDQQAIRDVDRSNFCQILLDLPGQCEKAKVIGASLEIPNRWRDFRNVVFTGLGGSAIGGDLVRSYLAGEVKIPIIVNRNYGLPEFVDQRTLLVVTSYSGNTEETLQAYEEGEKRSAKIIAVTSGGELAGRAGRGGVPLVTIPSGLPPRAALGYLFLPALIILSKIGIASDKSKEIQEAIACLRGLSKKLGPKLSSKDNQAKALASAIYGRFPLIYGSNDFFDVVTMRWRTQLAENSKHLASSHLFPELTHNEIVGWANPPDLIKKFVVIILRDRDDHPRIARRMAVTSDIIKKLACDLIEVWSEGEGILSRIYSLIYIGDFASFYLAILNGVDPTPVERIDYLKRELARR